MDPRAQFDEIAADLEARDPDLQLGQMMGHPCVLFRSAELSLALEGAAPFEPMGKGRVMKEWVDVPVAHAAKWAELADSALRLRKEQT